MRQRERIQFPTLGFLGLVVKTDQIPRTERDRELWSSKIFFNFRMNTQPARTLGDFQNWISDSGFQSLIIEKAQSKQKKSKILKIWERTELNQSPKTELQILESQIKGKTPKIKNKKKSFDNFNPGVRTKFEKLELQSSPIRSRNWVKKQNPRREKNHKNW